MGVDLTQIEAIIFDLGEVIINVDQEHSLQAFADLSKRSVNDIRLQFERLDFFEEYEVGAISDEVFRSQLRAHTDPSIIDEELDKAWNAMLGSIPLERIRKIESLRNDYRLFVMSNTNSIHVREFIGKFESLNTGKGFHDYFDEVYFSQEIHARKPQKEAWLPILEEHQLDPACTLFIDDRKENIDAANKLGLQTYHNVNREDWMSLF